VKSDGEKKGKKNWATVNRESSEGESTKTRRRGRRSLVTSHLCLRCVLSES